VEDRLLLRGSEARREIPQEVWRCRFQSEGPRTRLQRIYLEHFWNDFAADHNKSVSERDRQIYARAYAQPGAMQKFSRNFEWGATDFASFAKTKLAMLVLPGVPPKRAPRRSGATSPHCIQAVSGPTTNKSRSKQIRRMRQGQARRQLPIGPKMIVAQAAIPSRPAPLC
jgi:hypothetical protein